MKSHSSRVTIPLSLSVKINWQVNWPLEPYTHAGGGGKWNWNSQGVLNVFGDWWERSVCVIFCLGHLKIHLKGTVARDGFLAYSVPTRMQRKDLGSFLFWPKIFWDRFNFMSFAVFSYRAYSFIERLLLQRLISFRAFSYSANFIIRFQRQIYVKPTTVNLPPTPYALSFIPRLLIRRLISFCAFSYGT